MKSAADILEEALVGKTLVKRNFEPETVINREIVGLEFETDEDGDAKLFVYLKMDEDAEFNELSIYMNEPLELK